MRSLVLVDRPASHIRKLNGNGWRHNHLLSQRRSVRFSMFVAAQAVRSPAFREAVTRSTGRVIQHSINEHFSAQITEQTTPEEREHLEYMAGLRIVGTEFDQSTLPRLSAQLVYHLGQILYYEYFWAVHRFREPVLLLGDDPLVVHNLDDLTRGGSFGQVATAGAVPFSLWAKPEEVIERAVEEMRGHDALLLALDPHHLLALTRFEHLILPGRYDSPDRLALAYDLLLRRASRRWLCRHPDAGALAQAA